MPSPSKEANSLQPDNSDSTEQVFPIVGWDEWVNPPEVGSYLEVSGNPTRQEVTFTGSFNKGAGYVIERDLPFGGKILVLKIEGSENCSFDHFKMFKLEANDNKKGLKPIEPERENLTDSEYYVYAGDGTVSFHLPEPLTKLNFAFWNAELTGLKISGKIVGDENR